MPEHHAFSPDESRKCSRDTYPESDITKYTSIRRIRSGVGFVPVRGPSQDPPWCKRGKRKTREGAAGVGGLGIFTLALSQFQTRNS